jgi:hypothetical protein
MADLNAKVGSDNRGYEEMIGQHILGEMNESGEKFADLCRPDNLVIEGSILPTRGYYTKPPGYRLTMSLKIKQTISVSPRSSDDLLKTCE